MSGSSADFVVETTAPQEHHDLTEKVREIVKRADLASGICQVTVLHSTASIVVNENHDPNIGKDIVRALAEMVPERNDWLHDRIDDNAHSHIKAALLGPTESLPVRDGDLVLGTWQRILLVEFDGPRERRVAVQLLG